MKFEINFDHMPEYVLIRTDGEASDRDFDDLLTKIVDSPRWVMPAFKNNPLDILGRLRAYVIIPKLPSLTVTMY